MALQDEILSQSAQIKTDSYPMSIGELINLYRDEELDVHPEFQRAYRWTDLQKTRLIESILLGIPIPPIFVAQRKDGVWDVLDGVQRLSTIFQFVGELIDKDKKAVEPLVLQKTKFLPSLDGKIWDGGPSSENSFTPDQRLYLKRSRIDVNIVLKESDEKSKYELFVRLNTGGTVLEPQEVRNCLMIMAYPDLYEWIRKLSEDPNFVSTIALTERAENEQYPMELVTRFLAFRIAGEEKLAEVVDIGEYLNDHLDYINGLLVNQREVEEFAFRETFRALHDTMESDSFRRYDSAKGRFLGGFSIAGFEAIALGIGYNVKPMARISDAKLLDRVKSIWDNPDFTDNSGSGVRASSRIPKIIPVGRRTFAQ